MLHALVSPRNHFAHRCEIVHAFDRADNELSVIRFLHLPVFPDHHGSYGLCALNVRNVKAFDAFGQFGQAERVLQLFLNGLRVRLEHAKALIVGLFGIGAGQVDECAFVAALRNQNMHAGGAAPFTRQLIGEQFL